GCSPGCSKGPRHHPARPERREQGRTVPMAWLVEAAGRGWCDTLAWGHLRACSEQRVREGGRLRRLGTGRHAGGRVSGALRAPDKGTPPGGVLSPLVAKV